MANPANDPQARTLWIGDLSAFVDENFLTQVLMPTGAVTSVKVIKNKITQQSEGYGFLEFNSHEAAAQALATLNGQLIPNTDQIFRLNWAAFGVGKISSEDHSIFVGDLAADVTDFILQEHFRQYYPSVRSAKVITDPMTGRSKGYGFVRLGSEQERDRALTEMQGHFISNRAVRVSLATAKKNSTTTAHTVSAGIPHPSDFDPTNTTLFIGGLSAGVSEEDLRNIFGRFGDIIYTKIPPGKGCGFVQFVQRAAAEQALAQMQGQVIGTSAIRLSWGRSSTASRPPLSALAAAGANPYAYPSAYQGAGGYNPYDTSSFAAAAFGGAAGMPGAAADPYAAYYQGAAAQQPMDPSFYQSGNGAQANAPVLTAALQQIAKSEAYDPLAAVDVNKLNQDYIRRQQAALLGSHLHMTPTTG